MLAVCSTPVTGASQQTLLVRRLHLPIDGIVSLHRLSCKLVLELAALETHSHDLSLTLVGLAPLRSGWAGSTGERAAAGGIALFAFELFLLVVHLNEARFDLH